MKNKHSITRWLLAAVLPALFLAACSKDNEATDYPVTPKPSGGDIRFEIGFAPRGGGAMNASTDGSDVPQTRVATDALFNSTWEDGDQIGIFAVPAGASLAASDNYIHNAKLTYSSATNTWVQTEPLYWPTKAENMTALDFYAYYPYDASATAPSNIAFNVQADQSGAADGKSNYSLSDLLTAKAAGSSKGSNVTLTFSHALAMVQVSVPKEYTGSGPSEALTVTLRGVKIKSTLDLGAAAGPEVTLGVSDNAALNVTMHRVEQPGDADYNDNYTFRAMVPAQEIAKGNSLFLFEHEQRQLFTDDKLSSELVLTAGQAETFTRSLPASAIATVKIRAGKFPMGSPDNEPNREARETLHEVTLTKDFYMSKYQVTNAQYAEFLNANSIGEDGRGPVFGEVGDQKLIVDCSTKTIQMWGLKWDTDKWVPMDDAYKNHPVIWISWYGAKAYADWIGGSLPTEAQWEYACRGGTTTAYFFGDNGSALGDYAWYAENGNSETHAVGQKLPNAYGLYDMCGNVEEWCYDSWNGGDYSSDAVTDPVSPNPGEHRMLCGGSWRIAAKYLRSASRGRNLPTTASGIYGFRVVFVP